MDTTQQSELLGQLMLVESRKLENLWYAVLDTMQDFTADDVRIGNIEYVQLQLDNTTEARAKFRSAMRQFKRMFVHSHRVDCLALQKQLDEINLHVEKHADTIWSKVGASRVSCILFLEKVTL